MPAFHSQNNKLQPQPNSRSILTSLTRDSVLFSVQFSPTLCNTMDCSTQASLSITNSRSLLKLLSIESVIPSNHLILCCPLLFVPLIVPSIRVFSGESALHIRWPKYWSFSFSTSPSNKYSGLISFRMDWFGLLAFRHQPERIVFSKLQVTGLPWWSRD